MSSPMVPILVLVVVTYSGLADAADERPRPVSAKAPAAIPGKEAGGARVPASVTAELRKRDLLKWSDELAAKLATADTETLALAAEVFCRAGQPERVSQVVSRVRGPMEPGNPERADFVAERLLAWRCDGQTRAWFDAFPTTFRGGNAEGRFVEFLDWLVRKEGAAGAEAWLEGKARAEAALAHERRLGGVWAPVYWRFLADHGKIETCVNGLAEQIKQAPADADLVFEFLTARWYLHRDEHQSDTWLAETCRLEHAVHNYAVGNWVESPEAAIRFYDRSLACPVTEFDRQHFNEFSSCSRHIPPEEVETLLRSWTKVHLAEACLKAKQLDRAQRLVEELTGKKDGTLEDLGALRLAGQVQQASGKRVVEGRIKKAEEERKDSGGYWLSRVEYYSGRHDLHQVEQAYQAALKLPPDRADSRRHDVMWDYGWFLINQNRLLEAARLWRDEAERLGPKAPDTCTWLQGLLTVEYKGGPPVKWDDPLFWQWLAARREVDISSCPDELLGRAADMSGPSEEFEKKARAVAAGPCPVVLRFRLGEILHNRANNRANDPNTPAGRTRTKTHEGLRMMAEAYDRWPNGAYPYKRTVGPRLLQAYLAEGETADAEKLLETLLREEPFFGEDPEWLAGFAVAAAKGRALDLAMRLWRAKANLDLTDQRGLEELAANGAVSRLRDFYSALAKQAPGNAFVALALNKLATP